MRVKREAPTRWLAVERPLLGGWLFPSAHHRVEWLLPCPLPQSSLRRRLSPTCDADGQIELQIEREELNTLIP
jgi:hypothetical protein